MGLGDILVPPARTQAPGPITVGAMPLSATGAGLIGPIANPSPGAGDWRVALLGALGAPVTDANLKALAFWHQSEGTAAATNNPLAISDGANRYPHAGCLAQCGSGSPIYAFPDQATGVAATAHFLQGSYYTRVVEAFRSNAGLAGIFAAINSSPWCAGCQSGHYPVALYNAVGNPNAPDPGPGPGSGAGSGSGPGTPGSTPVNVPVSAKGDCLLGDASIHNPIPGLPNASIPCFFYKSWGWAILGALGMVAGAGLMAVGGILLVTKANSVGQAAGMLGGPLGKAAAAGSSSGSLTRSGAVRPLQTEDQVDENRYAAAQEREVDARRTDPDYQRRVRNARRGRMIEGPGQARARRRPTTAEEPF